MRKLLKRTVRTAVRLGGEYHKDRFTYEEPSDSYTCPRGAKLQFSGVKKRQGRPEMRVYRASKGACLGCSAFGQCTKDSKQGRALEIGPHEEARALYGRRKGVVEPSFGILKELMDARRFLLRGLRSVGAEWVLLATAFNLRTLYREWRGRAAPDRAAMLLAAAGT